VLDKHVNEEIVRLYETRGRAPRPIEKAQVREKTSRNALGATSLVNISDKILLEKRMDRFTSTKLSQTMDGYLLEKAQVKEKASRDACGATRPLNIGDKVL
jgi:hypothetical protein